MGFDSATSSFLALLVNNSHRKLKKAKLKTEVFNFAVENYFLSRKFCKVTYLRDLKSFVGQ